MLGSLFLLLSLAIFAYSCSPQTVDDVSTKDTPTFTSGSITSDTLLMTFSYPTYGAETGVSYSGGNPSTSTTAWQRYINSTATGFVQVANAGAVLCSPLSTQISSGVITNIITYEDGSCNDSVSPSVTWSTVKNACGNQYFVSSGGTNGASYEVDFVYRVTYVEQLSSGDTRSVSNDYSFKVLSPTEFTIDSSSFQLANVATQVSAQIVQVDLSGQVTLNVQAIATCGATLTAVTIGSQVGLVAATPSILSSGAPGTQYASGTKYAGLCPYYWTVAVDPDGCSLSGNFHVTYDFTPTGSTAFTTPDVRFYGDPEIFFNFFFFFVANHRLVFI